MSAGASAVCQADYGKRSEERVNSRNGYRERRWDKGRCQFIEVWSGETPTRRSRPQ